MTNHKEILRLKNLGLSNAKIAAACCCGRNTVTRTVKRASETGLNWTRVQSMSLEEVYTELFRGSEDRIRYRMPDYKQIHREMQKSGVTLSLLWAEYCDRCRMAGELPYQATQFNKYYADYVSKTNILRGQKQLLRLPLPAMPAGSFRQASMWSAPLRRKISMRW